MRFTKLFTGVAILIATALVGGTLIGSALAAPREKPGASNDAARGLPGVGPYCEVFVEAFAAELGVSPDALPVAARTAAQAALDAAVADGRMNAERAERMAERIDAWDGDLCRFAPLRDGMRLGGGKPEGAGGGRGLGGLLNPAAEALGMTPGELRRELRGSSLEEVAGADYALVRAAILEGLEARLADALADGLPPERADAVRQRVAAWLDEGGPAASAPGPGMGRGGHGGGGPPPWAGQDEGDDD